MIVETGHYALVLALALALVNSVLPVRCCVGDRENGSGLAATTQSPPHPDFRAPLPA